MARIARVVVPNIPHHITQRGNRKQQVFFQDQDYQEHLALVKRYSEKYKVSIWAYCLMPNQVHLIATPHNAAELTDTIRTRAALSVMRSLSRRVKICQAAVSNLANADLRVPGNIRMEDRRNNLVYCPRN